MSDYRLSEKELARFWDTVDKTPGHGPNGDCWLWTNEPQTSGYGQVEGRSGDGRYRPTAHRQSLIEAVGFPPKPKMHAAHSCHVKLCVNPAHLRWATPAENTADNVERGIKFGKPSSFSEEVREEIRKTYVRGVVSLRVLAEQYGCSPTTISLIVNETRSA